MITSVLKEYCLATPERFSLGMSLIIRGGNLGSSGFRSTFVCRHSLKNAEVLDSGKIDLFCTFPKLCLQTELLQML